MSARIYTPEEEELYKLRPLPDIPFIGVEESRKRREAYKRGSTEYRVKNPIIEAVETADLTTDASTRTTKK